MDPELTQPGAIAPDVSADELAECLTHEQVGAHRTVRVGARLCVDCGALMLTPGQLKAHECYDGRTYDEANHRWLIQSVTTMGGYGPAEYHAHSSFFRCPHCGDETPQGGQGCATCNGEFSGAALDAWQLAFVLADVHQEVSGDQEVIHAD